MEKCKHRHTKVQVPDEEWVCPRCGARARTGKSGEGWLVQDSSNFECDSLHVDDELGCEACGARMSGQTYSNWYRKKKSMVECPRCKGKGFVKRDKA